MPCDERLSQSVCARQVSILAADLWYQRGAEPGDHMENMQPAGTGDRHPDVCDLLHHRQWDGFRAFTA